MPTPQHEFTRLKRRLTFRTNKLKWAAARLKVVPNSFVKRELVVIAANQVIKEVDYALNIFEDVGYPDLWNTWTRAQDDAKRLIQLLTF